MTSITISKPGYQSVTLYVTNVKDNWNNAIETYNRLRTKATYSEEWQKYILDFKNITRRTEFQGYLLTEQGVDCVTARNNLIKIFHKGGADVTITYLSQPISGSITALEIREFPADANTPRFFLVILSLVEGDPK